MNRDCDCCTGMQPETPQTTANRPGLSALTYRVGTHASFRQTMLAGLSSQERLALARLKTRLPDDFAIALLDAWATVADVLTFYQERIANEGYLRTATERRSILELARLVGYELRPGVAASVYLAFTLDPDCNDETVSIPAGTQAQSVPQANELPQTFETAQEEPARTDWNQLQPRLTRPQYITPFNVEQRSTLWIAGIDANLKANDRLLFMFDNRALAAVRALQTVDVQASDRRTALTLLPVEPPEATRRVIGRSVASPIQAISSQQLRRLTAPPTLPPRNQLRLTRSTAQAFNPASDFAPKVLTRLLPTLKKSFYPAWRNTPVTAPAMLENVYKFGVKASPFGHNAPLRIVYDDNGRPIGTEEWPLNTVGYTVEWLTDADTLISNVLVQNQGRQSIGRLSRDEDEVVLDNVRVTLESTTSGGEFPQLQSLTYRFFDATTAALLKTIRLSSLSYEPASQFEVDSEGPRDFYNSPADYTIGTRTVVGEFNSTLFRVRDTDAGSLVAASQRRVLPLDGPYDQVLPQSWVLLERPGLEAEEFRVIAVQSVSLARYGITGKVTQLLLDGDWLTDGDRLLSDIRDVTIYAQSEPLTLTEAVIDPVAEPVAGADIELAALYDGLAAGRWLIICGERTDIPNTAGVEACELVMLAAVRQDVAPIPAAELVLVDEGEETTLPGDTPHSFLQLATPLAYTYKRDTVTIYGNVAKATHGETHTEVLGSGDGSQSFQTFMLRQPPLTQVSAPTAAGIQSTLQVRVNQVQWHEVRSLGAVGPGDLTFTTRTDDAGNTTVTFGDGQRGARLPSGIENVQATYRSGIGRGGNVQAEQISLLGSRPLGVKAVINPLAASGGADAESRDQARLNVPLAVMALDRLVSLQDYEDFARTFAGVGKASAVQLTDGRRQVIHLTIAGEDDIPITPTSDLYRNLQQALRQLGSPNRWVQLATRDLMVLIIAAKVRLQPDYAWEFVGPAMRARLLDTFSFQQRALGQDVQSSEVIAAMHAIPGVAAVDLDVLASLAESDVINPAEAANDDRDTWLDKLAAIATPAPGQPPSPRLRVELGRVSPYGRQLLPAQLALLSPTLPDTLKLEVLS